jgi:hypothetical protein
MGYYVRGLTWHEESIIPAGLNIEHFFLNSSTRFKRSPLGQKKTALLSYKTDDLLKEVQFT